MVTRETQASLRVKSVPIPRPRVRMLPTLVKRPVLVRLYSMTRFRPVTLVIANAAPVPRWTSLILDHRMSVAGAAPRQGERVETGHKAAGFARMAPTTLSDRRPTC